MIINNILEKILKKYKLVENSNIDMKLINIICTKENISIQDLKCMFQINNTTMRKLKNGYQINTKLNFNKYYEIRNKGLLVQTKLNYNEFNNLKNKLNIKAYPLLEMLGITVYKYKKMKNDMTYEVIIKDMYIKHIVDLIKIDLKYQIKGNQYFSINRIESVCKKRGITINQFAKYYNDNPKHYKFNIMIIEKSSKGFWISADTKIPNDFVDKHYYEIMQRLKKVANKVSIIIGCNIYKEDLVQEAMNELYLRCGNIVQNFYFDINVLFNILMDKAKYYMFNIYRKKYKIEKTISYNNLSEKNNLDYLNVLKDNTYNPEILLD